MNNLKDVNSFLLNCYIDKINEFVGEEVISHTTEELACNLNNNTFEFIRKLAERISEVQRDKTHCVRNCCFRKIKK
mgnify:CR=1 FL=1